MRVVYSIILVAGALAAPALRAQPDMANGFTNGLAAVVHDSVVSRNEVDILNEQTAYMLAKQYRDQEEMFQKKMAAMVGENLTNLIDRQLILHDFKVAGYNLPESVIEELVQERIRSRYGDRMKLIKTLEADGITYEKFRQQVRDNFIVEALRAKNISQELIISPHKIEVYYLAHRDEPDFKVEDEIKLRMIVLNKSTDTNAPQAASLAEDILVKLKNGASFDEMATLYSQGSTRSLGGNQDWVEKSVLRKELADAAFGLKPGQYSGVIDTPQTCYLVLVLDARPAHVKPLADVREQIEKDLIVGEQKRLEQQWIGRLWKKTFVQFH